MNQVTEPMLLRPAEKNDMRAVFEWRNHPDSRKNFGNSEEIDWPSHQKWFTKKLAEESTRIYIGIYKDDRAGIIRFEKTEKGAEVSVNVRPGYSGRGIGTMLIRKGTSTYLSDAGPLKPVVARINKDNHASQRSFEKSGYVKVGEDKNQYIYSLEKPAKKP